MKRVVYFAAIAIGLSALFVVRLRQRPHWETRCVASHSFVLVHFDYTRNTTLPRYTTFCDRYASMWIGAPGVNVEPVAPADPITFER